MLSDDRERKRNGGTMMIQVQAAGWLGLASLCSVVAQEISLLPASGEESAAVDFAKVKALAAERALRPFVKRRSDWPAYWNDLTAHDYEKIKVRAEKAWWHEEKLPFALGFLHPGGAYRETTSLAEIVEGHAHELEWKADFFDYEALTIPNDTQAPPGYAGFKVLMPLLNADSLDAWTIFEATNLFRCVAPGLEFGVSSRGVAINPADPALEETAIWQRFWFEKPAVTAKALQFFTLLDSPSVCGAYRFRITPGRSTVMEVEAELTFRQSVTLAGLAPLSSMCWFSELTQPKPQDYRPEVHHSDGLLIQQGDGEVLWQPLDSGKSLRHSEFAADTLLGFGLIQRDRLFGNYQDLSSRFHERPSAYIEPVGTWPPGKLHLFEQPATDAHAENVLACWEPTTPPKVGQPFSLGYRIHWLNEMSVPGLCKVLASRRSQTTFTADEQRPNIVQFYVDYSQSAKIIEDAMPVVLTVDVSEGVKLLDKQVEKNPDTGGWRGIFRVQVPLSVESFTSNCRLLAEGRPISERWTYQWKR